MRSRDRVMADAGFRMPPPTTRPAVDRLWAAWFWMTGIAQAVTLMAWLAGLIRWPVVAIFAPSGLAVLSVGLLALLALAGVWLDASATQRSYVVRVRSIASNKSPSD